MQHRILGAAMGRSLVARYLEDHPELVAALADANAVISVFEPDRGEFFADAQRSLTAAEAETPANAPTLYVAQTTLPDLRESGAFDPWRQRATPALACQRGVFLGYMAIGEGGVIFFDPEGRHDLPQPARVLAALQRCQAI